MAALASDPAGDFAARIHALAPDVVVQSTAYIGEGLMNEQYLAPGHHAPPISKEGDSWLMDKAKKILLNPLKQAMPIVGQRWDAGILPSVAGAMGTPIYGLSEEQIEELRAAVKKGKPSKGLGNMGGQKGLGRL